MCSVSRRLPQETSSRDIADRTIASVNSLFILLCSFLKLAASLGVRKRETYSDLPLDSRFWVTNTSPNVSSRKMTESAFRTGGVPRRIALWM